MWIFLNFIILPLEVLRWFNGSWRCPICFVVGAVRSWRSSRCFVVGVVRLCSPMCFIVAVVRSWRSPLCFVVAVVRIWRSPLGFVVGVVRIWRSTWCFVVAVVRSGRSPLWFVRRWSPKCFRVGRRWVWSNSNKFRARQIRLIRHLFFLFIILLRFTFGRSIIDLVSAEHARAMHGVGRIAINGRERGRRIDNDSVFYSTCVITKPIGHWVNTVDCNSDEQWDRMNQEMHVAVRRAWLCSLDASDGLSAQMLPAAESIGF